MSESAAIELVNIIFDYLNQIDDSCLVPFLANWPSKPIKTRTVSRSLLPVLSYLPGIDVKENDKAEETIKTLKAFAEHLPWRQTYTAEDFGLTFLENYGWTELIGSRGPIASKDIACGFLLLGPNIEYPKHSHEAEEVYVPFSSQTLWVQENDEWVLRPNGVPIYHSSWLPHGMRTGSNPLLALYLWRGGNLAQKSHVN
jgi:hypothetical protein